MALTEADKQWGELRLISRVSETDTTWEFSTTDIAHRGSQAFGLDKSYGVAPQVGQTMQFQGRGLGYSVCGVRIDGHTVYQDKDWDVYWSERSPFVVEVDNPILDKTNEEYRSMRVSSAIRFIADRLALFENNAPQVELQQPVEFHFVAVDGDQTTILGTLRLRQEDLGEKANS